jgi:hypothetical protein
MRAQVMSTVVVGIAIISIFLVAKFRDLAIFFFRNLKKHKRVCDFEGLFGHFSK